MAGIERKKIVYRSMAWKPNRNLENTDMDGMIILKWILKEEERRL